MSDNTTAESQATGGSNGFRLVLADLLTALDPAPGTMAADIQAAARRDGLTSAGIARLAMDLRKGRTDA